MEDAGGVWASVNRLITIYLWPHQAGPTVADESRLYQQPLPARLGKFTDASPLALSIDGRTFDRRTFDRRTFDSRTFRREHRFGADCSFAPRCFGGGRAPDLH